MSTLSNQTYKYNNRCMLQSQLFNPQNININISYNLGHEKASSTVYGKKIIKNKRANTISNTNYDAIEIKLNKKSNENNIKKANEAKKSVQAKKHKKKGSSIVRNTLTPQLFNDKKVKTEGALHTEQDIPVTTHKKQSKSQTKHYTGHYKSTICGPTKFGFSSKKITVPKLNKTTKTNHMNSCMLYSSKKHPLELGEHVISTVIAAPSTTSNKRKRALSATAIKNDKVVSKLLNISLLASELGGSQIVTSERRSNQSNQQKVFREYMNSVDLKIIKNMQNDHPFFRQNEFLHEDTVKTILRFNKISLEQLTRKIILIQRAWRKKIGNNVINLYRKMFKKATKKHLNENLTQSHGLSLINSQLNEGFQDSPEFQDDLEIFKNENVILSLKNSKNSGMNYKSDENSLSIEELEFVPRKGNEKNQGVEHKIQWIEESQAGIFPKSNAEAKTDFHQIKLVKVEDDGNGEESALNIPKYKQLVKMTISKQSEEKSLINKLKEERVEPWNNINKQISKILNEGGGAATKSFYDELIETSKMNKKWLEEDIGKSSQKESLRNSVSGSEGVENQQKQSQPIYEKPDCEQLSQSNVNIEMEDDSLEESEEYDRAKYAEPKEESKMKRMQKYSQEQLDKKWISNQILRENGIVENFLDCNLEGFGLGIREKKDEKHEGLEAISDESIGTRFQQANLMASQRFQFQFKDKDGDEMLDEETELERQDHRIDLTTENIINLLISEFASDISIILKKSTNSHSGAEMKENVQPMKAAHAPPPSKFQGIVTNYNSIRDYVAKFLVFIAKQPQNLDKIYQNVNKDIGPSSLEILTYLRPELEEYDAVSSQNIDSTTNTGQSDQINEEPEYEDEEGLFVIPAELFQHFEAALEEDYKRENEKEMGLRTKAYLNFWHRCIFQSFNECLDYERPYGIEGKPYDWVVETKIFRKVPKSQLSKHLHNAENRLLELTSFLSGIIFDKIDSPFSQADLMQDQKQMINEERLSRMLAAQLFETEQSWINYNDEMAELQVELAKMIEERLFFEFSAEMKRLQRKRKIISDQTSMEQPAIFNIDQL